MVDWQFKRRMIEKYNILSNEYKIKGSMMLQKGEELMWKTSEAQRQVENMIVAEMAKGNGDIADQLKQIYLLLASCKGESSHARVERPLAEVSTPTEQSLVPARSQREAETCSGDFMVEDDNILTKIHEEPGNFEEI